MLAKSLANPLASHQSITNMATSQAFYTRLLRIAESASHLEAIWHSYVKLACSKRYSNAGAWNLTNTKIMGGVDACASDAVART